MFNKHNETKQRFSIKKYTFGVASALVGVFFFAGANAAQAEEKSAATTVAVQESVTSNTPAPEATTAAPAAPEAPVAPAVTEAPVAPVTEKGTAVTTPVKEELPLSAFTPKSSAAKRPTKEGQKFTEGSGFRATNGTATGVAIDGGKATASGTIEPNDGLGTQIIKFSYRVDIKNGSYNPGDKLTLTLDEMTRDGFGNDALKQLIGKDGIVYAKLISTEQLNTNGDGQASYWSQRNDNLSLPEKHAANIEARGHKFRYTYEFTDGIELLEDVFFGQTITGNISFPRVDKDKVVTPKILVNDQEVVKAEYTVKAEPLGDLNTVANFSSTITGSIRFDAKNEVAEENDVINFFMFKETAPTGTTFTYKIPNTDINYFKAIPEVTANGFPVTQINTFGGATKGTGEVNDRDVILFGQRNKVKIQVQSVTNDTLVFKIVEGEMLPGYTYQFNPAYAGVDRAFTENTIKYLNAGGQANEVADQPTIVNVVGPDGRVISNSNDAKNADDYGKNVWTAIGPNLSLMGGNPIKDYLELGNVAVRFVENTKGETLVRSISGVKIDKDFANNTFEGVVPTKNLTDITTDSPQDTPKLNNTTKVATEDVNGKTNHKITVPYIIKATDGTYYVFEKYADDHNAYPNDATKGPIVSTLQNLVATYKKAEYGTVNIKYVVDGNMTKELKAETKTAFDGTANAQLSNLVGEKYDVTNVVTPDPELTDAATGLVYVRTAKIPDNLTGDLTKDPINVYYTYEAKKGAAVKVNYETDLGAKIGTEKVVQATDTQVGTKYDTTPATVKLPEIVEGGVTYVLRAADAVKAGSAQETGTVSTTEQVVTYIYQAKQDATIKYVVEGKEKEAPLAEDKVTGLPGEKINYTTDARIKEFEAKNYVLVKDGFAAAKPYDNDTATNEEYVVTLKEKTITIKDPNDPQIPAGVTIDPLTNKVTRTINYVYEDGSKAEEPKVQEETFTRTVEINLVTKAVKYSDWSAPKTLVAVPTPAKEGYTPDTATVAELPVKAEDTPTPVTVTYVKDTQKAGIVFETNTGTKLAEVPETGKSKEPISTKAYEDKLKELVKQGYKVVADEFKDSDKTYDANKTVDQAYKVTLEEVVADYVPGAKPGEPVDPKNPDGPVWPATVGNMVLNDEVKQTITYVDKDGKELLAPKVDADKVSFTRGAKVNLVSGVVTYGDWKADNGDSTFDAKPAEVIKGYLATKATSEAVEVKAEQLTDKEDVVVTPITYKPVGKFIIVNPDGSTKEVPYENDPTDPTAINPKQPIIPYVEGYVPKDEAGNELPLVDPNDPTKGYVAPTPKDGGENTGVKFVPTDATANDPKANPVEKIEDVEKITEEDIIKAVPTDGLPPKTEVIIKPGQTLPTTDEPGDKGTVTVIVKYPDGTEDEVEVPVTVKPSQATTITPEVKPVEKIEDVEKITEEDIKGAVTIPGIDKTTPGLVLTIKDPLPTTDEPGDKGTVTVEITYPDGSKEEVEVPVIVKPNQATTLTPEVKPVEKIEDVEKITEEDIKGAVTIPGLDKNTPGLVLTIKDPLPTTDEPGDKGTVTVEITYPDGSKEEVEVPVKVKPSQATTLTPEVKPVEKIEDVEKITEEDIKGAVTIPGLDKNTPGLVLTIKDPLPTTDEPGDKGTVTVEITYPDGSKETVEVPVNVKPSQATTLTPEVKPVEKMEGTPLTEADITGAISGLPEGSKVVVIGTIPTTDTPGNKGTVTVEITYPDGSKEIVEVPVNVLPDPSKVTSVGLESPVKAPEKAAGTKAPAAKGAATPASAPAKASSSAKAGVLPKTSAAKGTETNTALPAGLAAALAAAGLLAARRRKED